MYQDVSYSELRENLKTHLDHVCSAHEPLRIKRRDGQNLIIMAEEDYASLEETAYLLRSPTNARRLLKALNTKRSEHKKYRSIKALRDELGI